MQPCPSPNPRETGARARLRPDTSVPAAICKDHKPETSQWPPVGDGGADQLIQTRATAQRQDGTNDWIKLQRGGVSKHFTQKAE